jgi:hypothetical protein
MNIEFNSVLYSLYPTVVKTVGDTAYDKEGVEVSYDSAAITTAVNWNNLRIQRNRLIAETDYLALSDATMTDDMKTYRQALRDLPANTTDPANPVWPTKPGGAS